MPVNAKSMDANPMKSSFGLYPFHFKHRFSGTKKRKWDASLRWHDGVFCGKEWNKNDSIHRFFQHLTTTPVSSCQRPRLAALAAGEERGLASHLVSLLFANS